MAADVIEFSDAQRRQHERDEEIIGRGLATFIEVGRALVRIRERRSYLLTHSTFGAYCRDRWRFNAPYAYNLMAGAEVIDVLEGEVEVLPANARVAYELRGLLEQPDKLVKTWEQIVKRYGDKPIALEVARTLRGGKPADNVRQLPQRASSSDASSDEAKRFGEAIVDAAAAVEAAKDVQRRALSGARADELNDWARQIKRLRVMATDLQRAVDRKR